MSTFAWAAQEDRLYVWQTHMTIREQLLATFRTYATLSCCLNQRHLHEKQYKSKYTVHKAQQHWTTEVELHTFTFELSMGLQIISL